MLKYPIQFLRLSFFPFFSKCVNILRMGKPSLHISFDKPTHSFWLSEAGSSCAGLGEGVVNKVTGKQTFPAPSTTDTGGLPVEAAADCPLHTPPDLTRAASHPLPVTPRPSTLLHAVTEDPA